MNGDGSASATADVLPIRQRSGLVKIDAVNAQLNAKIDAVDARLNAKLENLKDSINSAKSWALLLYVALAAGIYATMARGFGRI